MKTGDKVGFNIHPQLALDTLDVGRLSLSRLLLHKDANYPWLILVPERANVSELFQLSLVEQQILMREMSVLCRLMHEFFNADKMNVAALGNMVPQLHIHLIVRYKHDGAWPKPIWGAMKQKEYSLNELDNRIEQLRSLRATALMEITGEMIQ